MQRYCAVVGGETAVVEAAMVQRVVDRIVEQLPRDVAQQLASYIAASPQQQQFSYELYVALAVLGLPSRARMQSLCNVLCASAVDRAMVLPMVRVVFETLSARAAHLLAEAIQLVQAELANAQ